MESTKIRYIVLLLSLILSSIKVKAYDFEVDGLCYDILSNNEVEITYKNGDDLVGDYSGTVIIPEYVTYNGVVYHVTRIGGGAYSKCYDLTGSLTIPSSITYIDSWAFEKCSGLTGPLVIPNSVNNISNNAFSDCTGFTSLTIPNSVTSIYYGAFSGCSGLTGSLSIPSSITTIYSDTFSGCSGLSSLIIPNSVTKIYDNAFKNCSGLEHVYSNITNPFSISDGVFWGISSNVTLHIPKGTKELYQKFSGWTKYFKNIVDDLDNPTPQITTFILSITSTGNGSVSYGGETVRGAVKSYSVNEGMNVTINISPDSGYRIKSMKLNGSSVSATTSYSFTINSNTTIEVEFEQIPDTPSVTTYTLSITASGNGSANYGGEAIRESSRTYSVNEGSSVSISFTPDEGYRIESVKVNGSNIGKERSYSTTINANTTVEVVFEAIPVTTYTLTVTASGNGVATFDGTEVRNGSHGFTVNEGSDAIISFTPDKGYKVDAVKADGNEVEVSESYTISNITSDKTLEVVFAEMDRNFSIDGVGYQIESFEDKTVTLTGVQNSITLEVSDKINFQAQDWNIIGISENALENSEDLSAIIWNPEIPFTAKVANPNLLLYVKDEAYAPAGIRNVVVNGFAKAITLTDAQSGNNFYCPSAFMTQSIIYTHNYSMKTGINESKGWETIALPFDVQQISHSGKGEIIPFAKWNADNDTKPFWLYELKGTGFVEAEELKVNTPYIISMPNNDLYPNDYQLSGRVTFSALNAEVKKSDDIQTATFGNNTFVPAFTNHNAESGYYVLNVNNDFETYQGSANVGGKFILNLRNIHPFEAYLTSTSGTRSIDIFDSMTTGIRDVLDITDSQKTQKVYDLSGRLITIGTSLESIRQELPAGVYIINNKKMIIK